MKGKANMVKIRPIKGEAHYMPPLFLPLRIVIHILKAIYKFKIKRGYNHVA